MARLYHRLPCTLVKELHNSVLCCSSAAIEAHVTYDIFPRWFDILHLTLLQQHLEQLQDQTSRSHLGRSIVGVIILAVQLSVRATAFRKDYPL